MTASRPSETVPPAPKHVFTLFHADSNIVEVTVKWRDGSGGISEPDAIDQSRAEKLDAITRETFDEGYL